MTLRTLLLENALTSFMAVLLGVLNIQVSLDCILKVLFERTFRTPLELLDSILVIF
jgi:hypothetical protein